jgi:predicted DCC family thiol-disulfide oxidoreductase YuxK
MRHHDSSIPAQVGHVFYDAGCGICSNGVIWLKPLFDRLNLQITPLQEPGAREKLGLTPDELLRDIRLLSAEGKQYAGADAYRYVLRHIWWLFPIYLLSIAPLFRQLFNAIYRAIANRRHRLSAVCGIRPPKPR